MIRHLVWDFDGTLFDTYPCMARAFRQSLQRLGAAPLPSGAEIRREMEKTFSAACQRFVAGAGLDMDAFQEAYREAAGPLVAEAALPFPGIPALCRDALRAGMENFLFTHRDASALAMMRRAGLLDLFRDAVTCEAGFPRKPAPDALLSLAKAHGLDPRETLMIGDRELDVLSGRNAGFHACLLWGDPKRETRADLIAPDLASLRAFLSLPPEASIQAPPA